MRRRSEAGGGGLGVVLVLAVVAARVAERVWGRNNPGAGYIYIYNVLQCGRHTICKTNVWNFQQLKYQQQLSAKPERANQDHPRRSISQEVDKKARVAFHLHRFCGLQFSYLIAGTSPQKSIGARREQVPFSTAVENGELMHECFPKHSRIGTARLK